MTTPGAWPVDWVAVALERGHVVDIGQFSSRDRYRLDKAAKAGTLVRTRGYFPWIVYGTGPLKTYWVRPDRAAQLGIVA